MGAGHSHRGIAPYMSSPCSNSRGRLRRSTNSAARTTAVIRDHFSQERAVHLRRALERLPVRLSPSSIAWASSKLVPESASYLVSSRLELFRIVVESMVSKRWYFALQKHFERLRIPGRSKVSLELFTAHNFTGRTFRSICNGQEFIAVLRGNMISTKYHIPFGKMSGISGSA